MPVHLAAFGLVPRTVNGLAGIVTMPFLHGGWHHLLRNTVPLCLLLFLLAGSRARSDRIVMGLVLVGGTLLWLFGRGGRVHVGPAA